MKQIHRIAIFRRGSRIREEHDANEPESNKRKKRQEDYYLQCRINKCTGARKCNLGVHEK